MFESIEHEWVGAWAVYMPQGKSPYDITLPDEDGTPFDDPSWILKNGDAVTILGAYIRPWLVEPAPILFYVYSHNTGQYTHITADDMIHVRPPTAHAPAVSGGLGAASDLT